MLNDIIKYQNIGSQLVAYKGQISSRIIFHIEPYEVGDYLLSSGKVIKNEDYTSGMDVIAVCVIPDNFIRKTGVDSKARFCALNESRNVYKKTATEDAGSMFNICGCVGESALEPGDWTPTNTLVHNGDWGIIPGQASHIDKAVENPYDPGTYWSSNGFIHHIASPYLYVNGKYVFNKSVYQGWVGNAFCMFRDINGSIYTKYINDSNHPAAQYCANYSTNGTSKGDWYLPSIGELGFIASRFDTINSAISKVGGTTFNIAGKYWSSTQYSADSVCFINTNGFIIADADKTTEQFVRPFILKDWPFKMF